MNTEPVKCPWCGMPSVEHETKPGHVHMVWVCAKSPTNWVGTFYEDPVTA